MDKIWFRNPSKSEVIGRCGGGGKHRIITQNRQNSNFLKKIVVTSCYVDTYLHHNIHAGYTDVN